MSLSSGGVAILLLLLQALLVGESDAVTVTTCPANLDQRCDGCVEGPHECLMCAAGYIPNREQTMCLQCPSNCQVCLAAKDRAECQHCQPGYYRKNNDMSCHRCPGNCKTCVQGTHSGICTECGDGWYTRSALPCSQCHQNCKKCLDINNCLECKATFFLKNGGCTSCLTGCSKCPSTTLCDICTSGLFWDAATGSCSSCADSNCLTCSTKDVCTSCASTHILTTSGTCLSKANCVPGSGQTSVPNDGCTACEAGYRVVADKTCKACPLRDYANCQTCNQGGRGQWWDLDTLRCLDCPVNCLKCVDLDLCQECVDGYYWDTATKTCKDCPSAPNTLGQVACNHCRNRYYATGTALCQTCPDASSATTDEQCVNCASTTRGQYWIPNQCQEIQCSSATDVQCDFCPDHYWDGNSCTGCTSSTVTSTTAGTGQCRSHLKDVCDYVACNGESISAKTEVCETCLAQIWRIIPGASNDRCEALSCVDPSGYSQAECEACAFSSGFYYDGSCKKVKAADCPTAASSVPTTQVTRAWCEACKAVTKDSKMVFYKGSATTTGLCGTEPTGGTCTAASCWQCKKVEGTGGSCGAAVTCTATSITVEQTCLLCGFYYDSSTSPNCYECTDATEMNTQRQCIACNYGFRKWATASGNAASSCLGEQTDTTPATIDLPPDVQDDPDSTNCPLRRERMWTTTASVRCTSSDIRRYSRKECEACQTTIWDFAKKHCIKLVCQNPWRKDKCEKCDSKYWAGFQCKDKLTCSSTLLTDTYRCAGCAKQKNAAGSTMVTQTTGQCMKCQPNCLSCNPSGCTTCVSGYYPSADLCVTCTATTPPTADTCNVCPGKFWNAGTCKACIANCKTCYDATTCAQCDDTYIWDGRTGMMKCSDCILNSGTECDSCRKSDRGNYFTSSKCYACPVGCSACSDYSVCTVCAANYYREDVSPNSYCRPCAGIDQYNTAARCTACTRNSYWDENADFQCRECPKNCAACSSGSSCSKCRIDTMWFDANINACIQRPGHCTANTNPGGCTACAVGYLLQDKKCIAGIPGCSEYDSATSCKTCETGRCYDEKNSKCLLTSYKCDRCERDGNNAIRCLTCEAERYLHPCVECAVANCRVCKHNPSRCIECQSGYYYSAKDNKCVRCGDTNCDACLDNTACKRCKAGYYIKDSGCNICGTNCKTCVTTSGCTECMPGYYKNSLATASSTNICLGCAGGCALCDSATNCLTCQVGYQLSSGACTACVKYCAKCYNSTVCEQCDDQHYLTTNGQQCVECSVGFGNCAGCDDPGPNDTKPKCKQCQKSYSLSWDKLSCVANNLDNCNVIRQRPKRCEMKKCTGKLVPNNETSEECVDACYNCTGYGCEKPMPHHLIPCPNLGTDHICRTLISWNKKVVNITRWCAKYSNAPCPATCPANGVDLCFTPYSIQEAKECEDCCYHQSGCNDKPIKYYDKSSASGVTTTTGIILLSYTLIFLHFNL